MSPQTSACPECDASVDSSTDTLVHEIVQCPECCSDLEVTALQPLTLELAPEVEEDWGE